MEVQHIYQQHLILYELKLIYINIRHWNMEYKFQNLRNIHQDILCDQYFKLLNKILLQFVYYMQYIHHLINSIHLYMMYDNKQQHKMQH